jgi:hypothetical protein
MSLVCLVFLSIGTLLFTQNPLFWLASAMPAYQYIREFLAFILVMQLTTRPPRHMWFRIISGAIAIALAIWCFQETYNNHMLVFDSLSFLAASVAIGISALEHRVSILDLVKLPLKNKKAKLQKEF